MPVEMISKCLDEEIRNTGSASVSRSTPNISYMFQGPAHQISVELVDMCLRFLVVCVICHLCCVYKRTEGLSDVLLNEKQTNNRCEMPKNSLTNNELCFLCKALTKMMNFFFAPLAQCIHIIYCFLCKVKHDACTKVTVSSLPANRFIKGRISCC